ncbi:MAG: hypothetical protein KBD78_06385 [Oligoflexales bacterium]|nr:hypothetical protein [Oligoflexales bacterium]
MRPNFSDDYTACKSFIRYLEERGEDYDLWELNECRLLNNFDTPPYIVAMIEGAGYRGLFLNDLIFYLNKFQPHFYLYSSKFDPYVPPASFRDLAERLSEESNQFYYNLQNSGHDGFYTEEKVWLELQYDR